MKKPSPEIVRIETQEVVTIKQIVTVRCPGCATEFIQRRADQCYCNADCNRKHKQRNAKRKARAAAGKGGEAG